MQISGDPKAVASLAKKLVKVADQVPIIPKNGRNDFHKYDYALAGDVFKAVRKLYAEHGIAFRSSVDGYDHGEPDNKGNVVTTVRGTATFIDDASGAYITTGWLGAGQDKGDKGIFKAITGGLKYAVMGNELLDTGDDPEATDGDGNSTKGVSTTKASSKKSSAPAKSKPASKPKADKKSDLPKPEEKLTKEAATLVKELKAADDHWKPKVRAFGKAHGLELNRGGAEGLAKSWFEMHGLDDAPNFWDAVTKWDADEANHPLGDDEQAAA